MFSYCFGTKRIAPLSTASIARGARRLVSTYHCSVSQGSITTPERSPRGTLRR